MIRRSLSRASLTLCVTLALAGCGGGAKTVPATHTDPQAASSGALHPVRVAKQPRIPPVAGLKDGLLTGWADAQLQADDDRFKKHLTPPDGAPIPTLPPGSVQVGSAARRAISSVGGSTTTLVLYDTAGQWGFLGELYAMTTANLAGHFGAVTTEPVSSYLAGQVNQYTATIYVGSTYDNPIPASLFTDVSTTTHPVVWINDNIWAFANAIGAANFKNEYGWDPTNSFFAPNGSVGNVTQVTYKSAPLTRKVPAGNDGGILHPYVLGGSLPAVTTLATAFDSSTSSSFPWAIRSGNLTYIGEIPFAYVNETDRIIAFEDLLFDALAPNTATRHRAMLRLEDITPNDDPTQLMTIATWLFNNHIPYGFNVVPLYKDPLGYYNNGVPVQTALAQAPSLVSAIQYMSSHGGVIVDEGYTHQYNAVKNPYTGVSGDDAEFFLVHIDPSNRVVWDGPPPEDSPSWASGRVASAVKAFSAAGLSKPQLWVTPHYFATEIDYQAVAAGGFPARYERSLYFSGILSGGAVNHAAYIGQFFPYVVQDVYGTEVLPENLGDYEPVPLNGNPVRLPADLINEAKLNLAVRDGFASFFYLPSDGLGPLQQTISGLQGLGYTFVSPAP